MIAGALALALLAAGAAGDSLGVWGRWGAFAGHGPQRCWAISQPLDRARGGFAGVGSFPAAARRNQFHARLSRPRDLRAGVLLAIGERRFRLRAGREDAWAADDAADRAIVAAMRGARSMSIESVSARGAPFADTYALSGAATAIDAAALACL